eukprot:7385548-Prymnesium_polylepis.2
MRTGAQQCTPTPASTITRHRGTADAAQGTRKRTRRIETGPGIPAQQMQRTGERACGSGTGQNSTLAEHAQHAPQPRSIAWAQGAT